MVVLSLLLAGGCSSGITGPADMSAAADLSASTVGDMSGSCTFVFSGDATLTVACRPFLCHPTGGSYESLDLAGPVDNTYLAHAAFNVDGALAIKSYTNAELMQVDVGLTVNGVRYLVNGPFGTASLTITDVTQPSADPCDGTAHGSAQASLVEIVDVDAGGQVQGPGRVTLNATF
jgi:hypothetical protein